MLMSIGHQWYCYSSMFTRKNDSILCQLSSGRKWILIRALGLNKICSTFIFMIMIEKRSYELTHSYVVLNSLSFSSLGWVEGWLSNQSSHPLAILCNNIFCLEQFV